MQVIVEYAAQLKRAAGISSETVELKAGGSLGDLVSEIARRHDGTLKRLLFADEGSLHPSVLLFVGDEQVRAEMNLELRDRDVVTFLSPISGG